MRGLLGIGLAVVVLGFAGGCGKKASTSAPAAAAGIEGGWTLVRFEAGGKDADLNKKSAEQKTYQATADKLSTTTEGKEVPLGYKLNPAKTPSEIDLTGPDGKPAMYGIYKLEGDTLTVCAAVSDAPADRPTEFKTGEDGKTIIMVLKKK